LSFWFKIFQIFSQVPAGSQNIKGFLKKFPFIYDHSQIWLSLLVDDCEFGYIEKLEKKNPDPHP
jgi:hypothetical protein